MLTFQRGYRENRGHRGNEGEVASSVVKRSVQRCRRRTTKQWIVLENLKTFSKGDVLENIRIRCKESLEGCTVVE